MLVTGYMRICFSELIFVVKNPFFSMVYWKILAYIFEFKNITIITIIFTFNRDQFQHNRYMAKQYL